MNAVYNILVHAMVDIEALSYQRVRGSTTLREIRDYLKEHAPDKLKEADERIAAEDPY